MPRPSTILLILYGTAIALGNAWGIWMVAHRPPPPPGRQIATWTY